MRMDASKTFVLIVGEHTNTLTKGSCFIKYECDKAVEAGIKIVVLYNDTCIDRTKCPDSVKYYGMHIPMVYKERDGNYYWDYDAVKKALES